MLGHELISTSHGVPDASSTKSYRTSSIRLRPLPPAWPSLATAAPTAAAVVATTSSMACRACDHTDGGSAFSSDEWLGARSPRRAASGPASEGICHAVR